MLAKRRQQDNEELTVTLEAVLEDFSVLVKTMRDISSAYVEWAD